MSSSVGGTSGLNLALLNQLLQRAEGGTSTETAASGTTTASQASDSSSFTSEADQLFTALDSDGDGKLSKSEIQTGFQKLSQDMQAVLLQQQGGASDSDFGALPPSSSNAVDGAGLASTFSNLDTDGDGVISENEFDSGLRDNSSQSASSGQDNATTIDATELLTSLLQSLRNSSGASLFNSFDSNGDGSISQSEFTAGISAVTDSSSASSSTTSGASSTASTLSSGSSLFSTIDSNGDGGISSDDWTKLLKDLQASNPGDLANQSAMMGLQQSNNLNSSLMFMLQSVDPSQMVSTTASA